MSATCDNRQSAALPSAKSAFWRHLLRYGTCSAQSRTKVRSFAALRPGASCLPAIKALLEIRYGRPLLYTAVSSPSVALHLTHSRAPPVLEDYCFTTLIMWLCPFCRRNCKKYTPEESDSIDRDCTFFKSDITTLPEGLKTFSDSCSWAVNFNTTSQAYLRRWAK